MGLRWDTDPPPAPWLNMAEPEAHWSASLERARLTPATGFLLGNNPGTGLPVYLTPDQLRTHMHVIGSTGVGKSFFIEGIIKSLILKGHGVCLIDPHGDLYNRIFEFCCYLNIHRPDLHLGRRVVPFDVGNTRDILGFNPVARNARVMTYQVVALMEAVRKCWGQGTFQETPRLARWLFNVAYAIIGADVTFVQSQHMVDPSENPYRHAITGRIQNPRIRAEWEWLTSMKVDRREERIESTLNRIKPFVQHELIRPILGQYTHTLDFPSMLDGRKILLVNLAKQNAISEDNQHLLGTLIVNELLTAAFARPRGQRTPFFAFIDEFQHFVTKDMCEILDGGRKFGLHLILAHQHLHQLKEKDPEVYYSVLTNARTKVVFGGLIDEDLDILAKELHTGDLDPNDIKDEIWQTKFRPVESTRTVCSSSNSEGSSASSGSVSHDSFQSAEMFIPGSDWLSTPLLTGTSSTRGSGSGSSSSRGSSSSYSESTAVVPWYEFHEFKELSSRTFRSLEEQLFTKKAQLKGQPSQHAAVLIPGSPVQLIKTATIREFPVKDRDSIAFTQACIAATGCYKTPEQAELEIVQLENKLLEESRTIDLHTAQERQEEPPQPAKAPLWTRTSKKPKQP